MYALRISRLVAAFAALAFLGCGGGDAGDTGDAGMDEPGAGGGAAAGPEIVDPATITGMIHLTGTPPANEPIDMSEEAVCAQKHSTQPTTQAVVANNGMLANVFVYVKEGLTGSFPAPTEPATIDQDGCVYIPHVTGVQVGQDITFENSDGLLHNIKTVPQNNPTFNISQPTDMTTTRQFQAAEVMVPVQCDVHGWMHAYIGVVDHPYFAVSGEDGAFRIENLPPGTYTIEAWHEKYGPMTQQVTLGPNATQEVMFTFDAAAQANAVVPLGTPIDPHDHGPAGSPAKAVNGTH